jgi:thiol-disulfide isomerase/thioredoxin
VALAVASGVGLWWQSRNGVFRPSSQAAVRSGPTSGSRSADGTFQAPGTEQKAQPAAADRAGRVAVAALGDESQVAREILTSADIGGPLGERATFVQFSSAFCAPCRATRRVLGDVARMVDGVRHLDIDAESRLDLVRRLDVRRTPTTFVLGPDGHVTHRASGQPRKADVIAALGAVVEFPI